MINRTLNINLDIFGGKETDWIHLFQEELPTDEIDHQEAAEIIDAAFDITPCFEGETEPSAITQEEADREERILEGGRVQEIWENIADIMKRVAGATFCEKNADGGWDLIIKIAVSDATKPYTLLVDGGTIGATQVVHETISGTRIVENSSQFTFDFPVIGSADFNCPIPFIIDGSTVYFQEAVTTAFRFSYQTQYDRVTITTKPEYAEDKIPSVQGSVLNLRNYDNGQIGQLIEKPCTVTGLYSGKSRQITLEVPEIDESIEDPDSICLTEAGVTATGGSRVCYKEITHITDCQCSGRVYPGNRVRTEKIVVPCPEEIKDCPAINPGCASVVSRVKRQYYVGCPDNDNAGEIDDPEFYEEKCCEPPPFGLPPCKTITTAYVGGKSIEEGEQHWVDHYSYADVTFHPVTPRNGVCGKTIVKQVISPKNCCVDVVPMSPHPENPTEIAPSSAVKLRILDGNLTQADEWVWTAGGGLYFSNGLASIIGGTEQWVYSPAEFCDGSEVRVDDGCSNLSMSLTNTEALPLVIPPSDRLVAPEAFIWIGVTGGVGPYTWSSGGDLTLTTPQGLASGLFEASADFCGTETVTVSDSCGDTTSCGVRSTAGWWELIGDINDTYCSLPFEGVLTEGGVYIGNGFKMAISMSSGAGGCLDNGGICPAGTTLVDVVGLEPKSPERLCLEDTGIHNEFYFTTWDGSCCWQDINIPDTPGFPYEIADWAQSGSHLYKWVC